MKYDDREALTSQLSELNQRSRWYAAQIWQFPFAYIAATAIPLSQLAEKPRVAAWAMLGSALLGALASVHVWGIFDGVHRAVTGIQAVEDKLFGQATAQWRSEYFVPLLIVVIVVPVVYFVTGVYLLSRSP